MQIKQTIRAAIFPAMATAAIIATGMIAEDQGEAKGYAAAMADVDAMVQPVGWETIRKTKEACEAKWKVPCVITGGYMPKIDVKVMPE